MSRRSDRIGRFTAVAALAFLTLGGVSQSSTTVYGGAPVETSVARVPYTIAPAPTASAATTTSPTAVPPTAVSSAAPPAPTETQRMPSRSSVAPSQATKTSTPTIKPGRIVSLIIRRAGQPDVKVAGGVPLEREPCGNGSLCYIPKDDFLDWVDKGSLPAFPAKGTTYGIGHSNHYRPVPLNAMLSVNKGDTLIVTTDYGVFTYTVTGIEPVPFSELSSRTKPGDIWDKFVPRLIIIVCEIGQDGKSYTANHVVTAVLKSAKLR